MHQRENVFWKGLLLIGQGLVLIIYVLLRLLTSRFIPLLAALIFCAIAFSSVPIALYELVRDLLHLPVSVAERQASTPVVLTIWWVVTLTLLGLRLWQMYRNRNAPIESSVSSHWRWWAALGFVISLLLMGVIVYQESTPQLPNSVFQAAATVLAVPMAIVLIFFTLAMLGILFESLQAKWGEQAIKRGMDVTASIVAYGCMLIFIGVILTIWYAIFRFNPPQNLLEWLLAVAIFAFLPGVPIFLLLRSILASSGSARHKANELPPARE